MANGNSSGGPNPPPANWTPSRKVTVGALAGALSVVLVWIANSFFMPEGKAIPAEVASAITTIISFIASYLIPEP
jgi:hypothetical protein